MAVMGRIAALGIVAALLLPCSSRAQKPSAADEPVVVFTNHPRLFLRPARLRLLRRERERATRRWQQFDGYLAANAPMPEPGFANALYYQVGGNTEAGRRAIAWALGPATDLRQLALVFDWCQDLLSDPDRTALAGRIQKLMEQTESDDSIPAVRARTLAAVALFDDVPRIPNRELDQVVHAWWDGKMAPALNHGQDVVPRRDAYALWELLHAVRDNTNLDLRESARKFFKQFPIEHLMSNYPAPFPGEDNDYRIGAMAESGDPDLNRAALSRAAELSMVALDTNAEESQYLQGWLMQDNFMLRGAFGAPYEFLWANPYQPGLTYAHVPLIYHNEDTGRLFVRSSWEDSAEWFGYFDGVAQLFRDGKRLSIDVQAAGGPLVLGPALISWGPSVPDRRATLEAGQDAAIFVGLAPSRSYQIEIDDEEVFEQTTDPSGILVVDLAGGNRVGLRVRLVGTSK
jgi:hypothetical protein